MNKRIDLSNLGGFPLEQNTLAFMQESYRDAFSAIAQMAGNCIIAGINITGNQATNGWISYNGELLPFVGGTVLSTFVVEELKESRLFADNESKEVYFTRRARFGSPGVAFSSLVRFGTVAGLWQKGDTKDIIIDSTELAADFDAAGLGRNSRIGWGLCDGQGGRPNVKGRTFVNYDPEQPEFDTIGKTGGEKTHILSTLEMPVHGHGLLADNTGGSGGVPFALNAPFDITIAGAKRGTNNYMLNRHDGLRLVQLTGGGQAHNNLQPYFVALKIIKL